MRLTTADYEAGGFALAQRGNPDLVVIRRNSGNGRWWTMADGGRLAKNNGDSVG